MPQYYGVKPIPPSKREKKQAATDWPWLLDPLYNL